MSGALFTLSTRIQPKGEVLAWGLFGGVALVGWVWSMTINGSNLESDDFTGDDDSEGEEEECGGGHGNATTVPEEDEDPEDATPYQRGSA